MGRESDDLLDTILFKVPFILFLQLFNETCFPDPPYFVSAAGLLFTKDAEFHPTLPQYSCHVGWDHHTSRVIGLDTAHKKKPFFRCLRYVRDFKIEVLRPRRPLGPGPTPGVFLRKGILKGLLNGQGYLTVLHEERPDVDNHL
ncbi:MAG: hypothetical protein A4E65_03678 [Syntrophorhabdus sp. PtaU1.Bin153]|nr:MAG: hypothetical protein A4E65_03678 [Syntrophorhabdus sp. PtaU1.Bin153]